MSEPLDIRAALRDRIARGIDALAPGDRDPDTLADAALAALSDGGEWLMDLAEQYQQRAHAAERLLAGQRHGYGGRATPVPGWRAAARRQLALAGRAVLEAVSIIGLTLFALWVSDWAQYETGSGAIGWAASLGAVGAPLAVLAGWRRWGRR